MTYELLGALPWRQWGVACCPDGKFRDVWSDGRGDNAGTCAACGKRARWDSSD